MKNRGTSFVVSCTAVHKSEVPQRFVGETTVTWGKNTRSFSYLVQFNVPLTAATQVKIFRVKSPELDYELTLRSRDKDFDVTGPTKHTLMNVIGPACLQTLPRPMSKNIQGEGVCDLECGQILVNPLLTQTIVTLPGVAAIIFNDLGFATIAGNEVANGN